jgi:hypothetical protein
MEIMRESSRSGKNRLKIRPAATGASSDQNGKSRVGVRGTTRGMKGLAAAGEKMPKRQMTGKKNRVHDPPACAPKLRQVARKVRRERDGERNAKRKFCSCSA